MIRVIAFLGVGFAFGSAGAIFGASVLGIVGFVIGGFIGFIVGGVLSIFLLPLAIGVATGLVAYDLMQILFHAYVASVVVGVVFFVVGLVLSMKLLSLASVIFGALLLFDALLYFRFPALFAILIAILMGVIGFWAQDGFESKGRQGSKFSTWSRTPPPASAVAVNPPPSSSSSSLSSVRYCAYCGSRIDNPTAAFCPNCGANLNT